MKVVIFSGGNVLDGFFVREAIKSADKIIAADSGAESCIDFRVVPSVVLGDFDSIKQQIKINLEKRGSEFISFKKEKNETDTELALQYVINSGATEVSILGGVGGNRLDHVLGNIFLSSHNSSKAKIYFINGNQKIWIAKGPSKEKIQGQEGDLLSLIPVGADVADIRTQGLRYSLKNETLFFGKTRGVSNVFIDSKVQVSFTTGILLLIQSSEI